jgi:ABC-type glutathione transport system ATPase component
MAEDTILSVRNLHKRFPIFSHGLFRREIGSVNACDDISFDLRRGETFALVGDSGSGKTTLGRLILGALRPDAGQVLYWRRNSSGPIDLVSETAIVLKPLRRELQMIFQDPHGSLNPHMTVGQIVEEPLRLNAAAGGPTSSDLVKRMIRKVGLSEDCLNRYPSAFSGGQRQRIGIARALVLNPSLVVCDEPVSALDASVQAQVMNLLADMQEQLGLTYLFITHDLRLVHQFADRMAVMEGGRLSMPATVDGMSAARVAAYTLNSL